MANTRIYYATHQVGLKGDGGDWVWTSGEEIRGVQSTAIATNFNLEQVFQLGEQSIYQNIENLPDVEVSIQRVLDGNPLAYHMATIDASNPSLAGRSEAKSMFALSVFSSTAQAAEGAAGATVACSGMFSNSLSFSFSTDGNFTEDLSLVGNHKVWANQPGYGATLNPNLPTPIFSGQFSSSSPSSPLAVQGVNRKEHLLFNYSAGTTDINGMVADADCTIIPPEVYGISNSGTNEKTNGQDFDAHLVSITASVDLAREQIDELGRRGPYTRIPTFPVEVTCEITATATSGDFISATEEGIYATGTDPCDSTAGNLQDRTIRIATCEGTRIYLGTKNRLASVNYSGGDAGGGNVEVSYTFTTFNDFTVIHSGDPNASGSTWWTNRADYLVTT